MKADIKARWLEALRSGKYQQGENVLRAHDKFCCLGVLCDITDPDGWGEPYPGATYLYWRFDANDMDISNEMRAEYDISPGQCLDLMKMNDDGIPFNLIADYIEKHL